MMSDPERISRKLYKFRSVAPGASEFVSRILTHSELFFPFASALNDPWECRPLFKTSATGHSFVGRQGAYEIPPHLLSPFDREYAEPVWEPDSRSQSRARDHVPWGEDEDAFLGVVKDLQARIGEGDDGWQPYFEKHQTVRLCSFSGSHHHPLLWSHYADGHQGLCIEFDAAVDHFSKARPVTYATRYPLLGERRLYSSHEDVESAALMHKSDVWRYEDEYRLLAGPESYLNDHGIYRFPTKAVTGIFMGCRMSDDNRASVRSWLPPGAKLYQARVHHTRYELIFDEVDVGPAST